MNERRRRYLTDMSRTLRRPSGLESWPGYERRVTDFMEQYREIQPALNTIEGESETRE